MWRTRLSRKPRAWAARLLLLASAVGWAEEARYVGSQACAGCHRPIYDSFRKTAMGRSMGPAGRLRVSKPATMTHPKFERVLRVWREGEDLYQGEAQLDVFETKYRLEYAIGSGVNGYTYLVRRGGRLFQAPLSYYTRAGKWDLSPGYENGDFGFSRLVPEGCLVCHSGRSEGTGFSETAIGCENCHGPGSLHASGRGRMVNPAKLQPRLAEQICMYCHQGGDTRVLQPGKAYRDFRPGTWLNETLAIGNLPATERDADLLEHHNAMQASRCFRASAGKLSCLTCHDPHSEPAQKAAWYRAKCLGCHTRSSCTAAAEIRRAKGDDCAACHMPKRQDPIISHSALTNHRIVRTPEAAAPAARAATDGIVYVNETPGGKPLAGITLLRIYGELMDREPGLQLRYLALLEKLSASEKPEPLVLAALGRKELRENNAAGAMEHLSKAIDGGFRESPAFEDLAEALSRSGRTEEAVAVLERGIGYEPFSAVLQKSLVLRFIQLKRYEEARAAMMHYVEIFPEDGFMRGLLAQVGERKER